MPKQPRYVKLPNGSYLEWPEGVSASDFKVKAQKIMAGQRVLDSQANEPKSTDPSGRTPTGEPGENDQRNGIQRGLDNLITPDPRREEWQSGTRTGVDAFARGVAENVIPVISHPFHAVAGAVRTFGNAISNSGGTPQGFVGELAKPMIEGAVEDYRKNGPAKALPHMAGQATGALATGELSGAGAKAVLGKASRTATAARQWWRPTSSTEIVPALEQSSRTMTDAINPNPLEANQFRTNIQDRMPEILDYAKRTKNPMKTRLEFAKAAEGAGTEVRNWYNRNLLKPVENEEVSVAGTGYRGRMTGEGPRATIGDIDQRLSQVNQELSPAYRARNSGQVGSKLATEAELNAEANSLRSILNRTMARHSGLSEEEVSSVRQMSGSLRHIARATDETVTQRGLTAARGQEGSLPMSKSGVVDRAWKGARGGQGAIQDRAFQKALVDFNDQRPSSFHPIADKFAKSSRPLKDAAARNPRPARQPATGPIERPSAGSISTAEQQEFIDKVNERIAGQKKAIAQRAQERIEAAASEEARKAANRATHGNRINPKQ